MNIVINENNKSEIRINDIIGFLFFEVKNNIDNKNIINIIE
jgi:hypothetical protein